MTNKLFRTLKITCLCMALTAALPIVSFADETTAAVKEDKMVVRIIHLDENGNLLEEDKQTATEETESSEETTDKEEANADEAVAEADSDEEEAAEAEADEAAAELEAAIEVENDLRSEIVTYALQFVGNRYKYGGTNPNTGVDCSGFTMNVYAAFGISLPHYSGEQINYGQAVSYEQLQPGDLICFSGHVAIYIGGGMMVHAASAERGIVVDNVFYNKQPIGYRRLV